MVIESSVLTDAYWIRDVRKLSDEEREDGCYGKRNPYLVFRHEAAVWEYRRSYTTAIAAFLAIVGEAKQRKRLFVFSKDSDLDDNEKTVAARLKELYDIEMLGKRNFRDIFRQIK
jgi:hypothetical protein